MDAIALATALRLVAPEIGERTAHDNAAVASAIATQDLPAALLLAIGYIESRFDPLSVSRPHGDAPPYYCSILQTRAMSDRECVAQRQLEIAYRQGVDELSWWYRYCDGDHTCMLLGHGCGFYGVRTGRCNRYPERVMRVARKLGWSQL